MTDLLRKASGSTRAVPTTLSLPKANGSTTAELTVATGWNTTTDLDVIIYRRQLNTTTGLYEKVAGTQTEWVVDSLTGTTLSGMALRAGTEPASGYAADGNTVIMCGPTSAYADDLYTWGNSFATPQGALRSSAVQTALGISGGAGDGWSILNAGTAPTVSSGYNKGNKEYDLTFSGVDLTSVLSPGMRLKLTRGTTAPTQCADLESTSSQYASKSSPTGISFTDDFTCETWVKLESYVNSGIITRFDSTQGWGFYLEADGRISIRGYTSTGYRGGTTYQSLPLNRWVHIAASLDMSASSATIYIDGISVPVSFAVSGTSPTAMTQGGPLQVGGFNSTLFFDGKIADARVWSTIRTATQIRDNMNIQQVGNESGLAFYAKLNGNLNDSTSNANNLTGSGGAVATNVDNPMNSTEYAIIHKVVYSTNTTVTVFTGKDYNIPNMTFTNPYYSTQATPYGFPRDTWRWSVEAIFGAPLTSASLSAGTWTAMTGAVLSVPTGSWSYGYKLFFQQNAGSSGGSFAHVAMDTSAPAANTYINKTTTGSYDSGAQFQGGNVAGDAEVVLTAQTLYNLYVTYSQGNATVTVQFRADLTAMVIYAKSAYL